MSLRSIARNYARALSDTLSDDGELRRVESDLLGFASAMEEIPELREFLAGPIIPAEGKQKVRRRSSPPAVPRRAPAASSGSSSTVAVSR